MCVFSCLKINIVINEIADIIYHNILSLIILKGWKNERKLFR